MIGLRWWSTTDISNTEELDEDKIDNDNEEDEKPEEENWYFESPNYPINNSLVDSNIFWFGQIGAVIFWGIFLILNVLGLNLFWVKANYCRECWCS